MISDYQGHLQTRCHLIYLSLHKYEYITSREEGERYPEGFIGESDICGPVEKVVVDPEGGTIGKSRCKIDIRDGVALKQKNDMSMRPR